MNLRCVTWTPVCRILIFKSRVKMSNHFNFVQVSLSLKAPAKKNASENVICSSRLLHILTNVGKQCGPNRHYKCRPLIAFANKLDPDQVRWIVVPDLDPNCLTLLWNSWNQQKTLPVIQLLHFVTYTRAISLWSRQRMIQLLTSKVMPNLFLHVVSTHVSPRRFFRADSTSNSEAHWICGNLKR